MASHCNGDIPDQIRGDESGMEDKEIKRHTSQMVRAESNSEEIFAAWRG